MADSDFTSDSSDDDMTAGQPSKPVKKKSPSGSTNPLTAGDMVNVVGATHKGTAGVITKFTCKKNKAYVQLYKDGQPVKANPKQILLDHLVKTSGNTPAKKNPTIKYKGARVQELQETIDSVNEQITLIHETKRIIREKIAVAQQNLNQHLSNDTVAEAAVHV